MKYKMEIINPNIGGHGETYIADSLGDAADQLWQYDALNGSDLEITNENGVNANHDVALAWLEMNQQQWCENHNEILTFVNDSVLQSEINAIDADFWESAQMDKDMNSRGIYA